MRRTRTCKAMHCLHSSVCTELVGQFQHDMMVDICVRRNSGSTSNVCMRRAYGSGSLCERLVKTVVADYGISVETHRYTCTTGIFGFFWKFKCTLEK